MQSNSGRDLLLGSLVLALAVAGGYLLLREPSPTKGDLARTRLEDSAGLEQRAVVLYRGAEVGRVTGIERRDSGRAFEVEMRLSQALPPLAELIAEATRDVLVQPTALVLWDRSGDPRLPPHCTKESAALPAPEIEACKPEIGVVRRADETLEIVKAAITDVQSQVRALAPALRAAFGEGSGLDIGARQVGETARNIDTAALRGAMQSVQQMRGDLREFLEASRTDMTRVSGDLSALAMSLSTQLAVLSGDLSESARQMTELTSRLQREPVSVLRGREVADPPLVSSGPTAAEQGSR